MVGIAQSVRAPDCGSGGRGFESRYPPHPLERARASLRLPHRLQEAALLFEAIGRSAAHVRRHAQSELELHLFSHDVAGAEAE